MKIVVAGSRNIQFTDEVQRVLDHYLLNDRVTSIISGMARGIDSYAASWARQNGVHLIERPANWKDHPFDAGFRRNQVMAIEGDMLLALWDGKSTGTVDMMKRMRRQKKPVIVVKFDETGREIKSGLCEFTD